MYCIYYIRFIKWNAYNNLALAKTFYFFLTGGHWLVMTVCIWLKGTDLGSGKAEQWLYRIISGFIYIFVFLNLHQGPTRARMAPYYCLIIVENAALYAVWLIYGVHDVEALTIMVPLVIFGGFFMGKLYLQCCSRAS